VRTPPSLRPPRRFRPRHCAKSLPAVRNRTENISVNAVLWILFAIYSPIMSPQERMPWDWKLTDTINARIGPGWGPRSSLPPA
jgi:hypothetical protein